VITRRQAIVAGFAMPTMLAMRSEASVPAGAAFVYESRIAASAALAERLRRDGVAVLAADHDVSGLIETLAAAWQHDGFGEVRGLTTLSTCRVVERVAATHLRFVTGYGVTPVRLDGTSLYSWTISRA
jgi:hypothetical protein